LNALAGLEVADDGGGWGWEVEKAERREGFISGHRCHGPEFAKPCHDNAGLIGPESQQVALRRGSVNDKYVEQTQASSIHPARVRRNRLGIVGDEDKSLAEQAQ